MLETPVLSLGCSLSLEETSQFTCFSSALLFASSPLDTKGCPQPWWHLAWVANNREGYICQAVKQKAIPALLFHTDPGRLLWAGLVNILVSRISLCVSWNWEG